MIHLALKAIFAIVIAILYTLFIAKRPNAKHMTRTKLVSVFIVGLIISGILLMSDGLYATSA